METQLTQIRDAQQESWNRFAPGWEKWDTTVMDFMAPMAATIIDQLQLTDTDLVLDVATGTGEPGLTIAGRLRNGRVIGTDLSDGMLRVAQAHAAQKGIRNYEVRAADVTQLPFADATFDAISCRMGFMFFPDVALAASELWRVLKPGGRVAASVWSGPEQNAWVTNIMGAIAKRMALPAPPPGAPGMFRCARPGLMQEVLQQAGFRNVAEQLLTGLAAYDTPEMYWQMMNEVGAPVVAAMSRADEATKALIKEDTFAAIGAIPPGAGVQLTYGAFVVSGEK